MDRILTRTNADINIIQTADMNNSNANQGDNVQQLMQQLSNLTPEQQKQFLEQMAKIKS